MRMINILNKAKEKLEMKIDHDPQTLQDLQVIRNLLLTELDRRLERYKQDLIKIKASDKERKRIKKRKNELKKLRGILMSVSESLERIHVPNENPSRHSMGHHQSPRPPSGIEHSTRPDYREVELHTTQHTHEHTNDTHTHTHTHRFTGRRKGSRLHSECTKESKYIPSDCVDIRKRFESLQRHERKVFLDV